MGSVRGMVPDQRECESHRSHAKIKQRRCTRLGTRCTHCMHRHSKIASPAARHPWKATPNLATSTVPPAPAYPVPSLFSSTLSLGPYRAPHTEHFRTGTRNDVKQLSQKTWPHVLDTKRGSRNGTRLAIPYVISSSRCAATSGNSDMTSLRVQWSRHPPREVPCRPHSIAWTVRTREISRVSAS